MRVFGLVGYPLGHSFSKKFFTEKFLREGISNCRYENFPLSDIGLFEELLAIYNHLEGLNITIPYKEKIIPYLHAADEAVKTLGACNCIAVNKGGLTGYNTDVTGFRLSLLDKLTPKHNKALILGEGGAAKAVKYVLDNLNIPYLTVSRRKVLSENSIAYSAVSNDIIKEHPLIINTTPVGVYPNIHDYPQIPYEAIGKNHYLFDLAYNPEKTVFLQKGELQGAAIANGYKMLVIQAEESWKIWNS